MSILLEAPSAGELNAPIESPTLQADAAWITLNALVPIKMDADRAWAVGLAMALQDICAFPVPLAAEETVSQSALVVACHVQAVDKLKVPEPPREATVPDEGDNW